MLLTILISVFVLIIFPIIMCISGMGHIESYTEWHRHREKESNNNK